MPLFELHLPDSLAKALRLPENTIRRQQIKVLKKLLRKARFTAFGQQYRFDEILMSRDVGEAFNQMVPVFDYNRIHREWWHQTLEGKRDVCWPGRIKYYALSSGTSESASKYIPVTNDLLAGNRLVMLKQLFTLRTYRDIPVKSIGKGWLTIGGSTDLQKEEGYYAGDLSGIIQKKRLSGFSRFTNRAVKLPATATGTKRLTR